MTINEQLRSVTSSTSIGRLARAGHQLHLRVLSVTGSIGLCLLCISSLALTPSPSASAATPTTTFIAASKATTASAQQLAAAEQKTRDTPTNGAAWKDLGLTYIRRAYETADPAFYPLASTALDRAGALLKNSADLLAARASLALARHQFGMARTLATSALALQPNSFAASVALVDATVELGAYDEAAVLVDRLIDQRTGVASLSRLSYLRQLQGDMLGAEAAMRSAVAASSDGSLDRSVTLAYLGEILLERGKGDAAARAFTSALAINPGSAVAAMGIARVQAGAGDWTAAAATLDALTDRVPVPGALGQRADVARARNDRPGELAADQLVDASISLFRANGAVVDSELAILLADRGPASSGPALVAARKAYADRKTIFTEDAMAWALFQSGQAKSAREYATRAVSSRPAVASVRWHAAAIFAAVGDKTAARTELQAAVANRWFSASQRPDVLALATQLGVQS